MNKSPKEIALEIDNRIFYCANYCISKGGMAIIQSQEAVFEKFREYKLLVNRGTFTIEELENDVYVRFGPFTDKTKKSVLTPKEMFDLMDLVDHVDKQNGDMNDTTNSNQV